MAPNTPPSKPYQKHVFAHSTVFPAENDGVYSFADTNGDGTQDLVYIKTRNTAAEKTVELHVADAASGYQKLAFQTNTYVGSYEEKAVWTMSSKGDLVYINYGDYGFNPRKIQYLVFTKKSDYQERFQNTLSRLDDDDSGTWCIAPTCDSARPNLYYIKPMNPWTGKVEVHVDYDLQGWSSQMTSRGWKSHAIELPPL